MHVHRTKALRASVGTAFVIFLAVAFTACARTDRAPIQQDIAQAEEAITQARRGQAEVNAALDLQVAEQKLSEARAAFQQKDYEEAGWLAEEALMNARLAEAKSDSARSQENLQKLRDTIERLQSEIERRQAQ